MVGHVLQEIRWEFPNGLAGKAWVFSGLEEVQTALTDAGATVSVSVATRPPAGPQTGTHGVLGPERDHMDAADREAMTRLAQRAFGRRAD